MAEVASCVGIFLVIFAVVKTGLCATGVFTLDLKFVTYENPDGRLSNGNCCDWDDCDIFPCDPFFQICLDYYSNGSEGMSRCPLFYKETGHMEEMNSIVFMASIGGTPNPIVTGGLRLPESRFRIKVEALDHDYGGRHGDIGYYSSLVSLAVGAEYKEIKMYSSTRRSLYVSGGKLKLKVKLTCYTDHYGPDCSTECLSGHRDRYHCDRYTGEKYCRTGYGGPDCVNINDCADNPCLHGGTCHDEVNAFMCVCRHGYTGKKCQINIDDCAEDPCQHGTCIDKVGTFACNCHPGYEGLSCGTNTDDCQSNPCFRGSCQDKINDFRCLCYAGYRGKRCGDIINHCAPRNNCVRGDCVNGVHTYTCHCHRGYEGRFCDRDIDDCASDPCVHGSCEDRVGSFHCQCEVGYTGSHCARDVDECRSDPCVHGTCRDGLNRYVCNCEPGYEGQNCGTQTNECASNPCVHGKCSDHLNRYECTCHAGHTGPHCEVDIDECSSSPCRHGECRNLHNRYDCICAPGYNGTDCDIDIDECYSNPCHHGKCQQDVVNRYECICDPGFTGPQCSVDIDECQSNPCQNGLCQDFVNRYQCDCYHGYNGANCEVDIDECLSSPCEHGYCDDLVNGYECDCFSGYDGSHCDVDINECLSNPCHHGICNDLVNQFECNCFDGYNGTTCNVDVDECLSNPCFHGHCIDNIAAFSCDCDNGYAGKLCEHDYCYHSSCNHGYCINGASNYTCNCAIGWAGLQCDLDVDDCLLYDPCKHGDCRDGIDTYFCECHDWWTGERCEQLIDPCQPTPCLHGQCRNCTDREGRECADNVTALQYACACDVGWTSRDCDMRIDHCANHACAHGRCENHDSHYTCKCDKGWIEPLCNTLMCDLATPSPNKRNELAYLLTQCTINVINSRLQETNSSQIHEGTLDYFTYSKSGSKNDSPCSSIQNAVEKFLGRGPYKNSCAHEHDVVNTNVALNYSGSAPETNATHGNMSVVPTHSLFQHICQCYEVMLDTYYAPDERVDGSTLATTDVELSTQVRSLQDEDATDAAILLLGNAEQHEPEVKVAIIEVIQQAYPSIPHTLLGVSIWITTCMSHDNFLVSVVFFRIELGQKYLADEYVKRAFLSLLDPDSWDYFPLPVYQGEPECEGLEVVLIDSNKQHQFSGHVMRASDVYLVTVGLLAVVTALLALVCHVRLCEHAGWVFTNPRNLTKEEDLFPKNIKATLYYNNVLYVREESGQTSSFWCPNNNITVNQNGNLREDGMYLDLDYPGDVYENMELYEYDVTENVVFY